MFIECDLTEMLNEVPSPGRIHHCMRSIGIASRALDLMIERVTDPTRKTFGKHLSEHGGLTSVTCIVLALNSDTQVQLSPILPSRVQRSTQPDSSSSAQPPRLTHTRRRER